MSETPGTPVDVKPRSRDVTDGYQKAPSRAMLRAVGMGDDDWVKPQVGIANAWNEITPCNMTLRKLAEHVKDGVRGGGGFPLEFGTITVSDGISMGHAGMHASLVSREIITDSVEAVVFAERLDGFVALAGCDKSMPAMLMASARLDLPSALIYNGSIMPGHHAGKATDITSVFEAVGACAVGAITEAAQINTILHTRRADLVALGRPMLWNPTFVRQAQAWYGVRDQAWPKQYWPGRSQAMREMARVAEKQRELQLKARPKRHAKSGG